MRFPVDAMGKYPTTGEPVWTLSQAFGSRKGSSLYGPAGHTGHDYPVSEGTSVYAVEDGVVADSRLLVWGETIFIRSVDDTGFYEHIYGHLSQRLVQSGETVKKGQLIAYSGNTGAPLYSNGPHLHFEIKKYELDPNGKFTNEGKKYSRGDENKGAVDPMPLYDHPNIVRVADIGVTLYFNGKKDMRDEARIFTQENQGKNVKAGKDIYFIEAGTKRKYTDEAVMWAHGFSTNQAMTISQDLLDAIPTGKDMEFFEGKCVEQLKQVFFEVGAGNADKFFKKYFL